LEKRGLGETVLRIFLFRLYEHSFLGFYVLSHKVSLVTPRNILHFIHLKYYTMLKHIIPVSEEYCINCNAIMKIIYINTILYNNERKKKKNRTNNTKTYTISLNTADPSGKHNT